MNNPSIRVQTNLVRRDFLMENNKNNQNKNNQNNQNKKDQNRNDQNKKEQNNINKQ